MAITRLERKGRRNKNVAKLKLKKIKVFSKKPVIKKVDIEAIKADFFTKLNKPAKVSKKEISALPKKETAKVEEVNVVADPTSKDLAKKSTAAKGSTLKKVAEKKNHE